MKHVVLAVVLITSLAFTASSEEYAFLVERDGEGIGHAVVALQRMPDSLCVDYRLLVRVRRLGISLFSLERQQVGLFDASGALVKASAVSEKNGRVNTVELRRSGSQTEIIFNGELRRVATALVAGSTLSPLAGIPKSGDWIDLSTGELVPYSVSHSEISTVLHRPRGRENLIKGPDGFLRVLETIEDGPPVVLTREASAPADEHDHPWKHIDINEVCAAGF